MEKRAWTCTGVRRLSLFLLVPYLLLGNAQHVFARHDAKALEKQAKLDCSTGDYREGVKLLGELYVESDIPTYIYNQGRCYEQNDRWNEAISRFREYLRKSPKLTPEERASVESHIAECEAHANGVRASEAPVDRGDVAPPLQGPAIPGPRPGQVTSSKNSPLPIQAPDAASPSEPTSNPGRGLRIGGLITAGVGLVGVGVGTAFLLKFREKDNEQSLSTKYNPALADEANSARRIGLVTLGIGGALLTTGVVLAILGYRRPAKGRTVAFYQPLLGPGVLGVSMGAPLGN